MGGRERGSNDCSTWNIDGLLGTGSLRLLGGTPCRPTVRGAPATILRNRHPTAKMPLVSPGGGIIILEGGDRVASLPFGGAGNDPRAFAVSHGFTRRDRHPAAEVSLLDSLIDLLRIRRACLPTLPQKFPPATRGDGMTGRRKAGHKDPGLPAGRHDFPVQQSAPVRSRK